MDLLFLWFSTSCFCKQATNLLLLRLKSIYVNNIIKSKRGKFRKSKKCAKKNAHFLATTFVRRKMFQVFSNIATV